MKIPVGVKGYIRNEGEPEPYVLVEDNLEKTGGYLILLSSTFDFRDNNSNGHDYWVLKDDLEAFIQDYGWEIDWLIEHENNTSSDQHIDR